MKIFEKRKEGNKRRFYFFGMRVLSYTRKNNELPDITLEKLEQFEDKEVLMLLHDKIDMLQQEIKDLRFQAERYLYYINMGMNTTFRYMTGLQLNKDCMVERVVIFDPQDAPKDHFQRYFYASQQLEATDIVLDCACGIGYGSNIMAEKATSVVGVDISEHAINFAKKIFLRNNIEFICENALTFNSENCFDKIVSFETIEHLVQDQELIKHFYDLLKSGGKFISSVPNESVYPYSPQIAPFHVKHYTSKDYFALLENAGFKIEQMLYQYDDGVSGTFMVEEKRENEGYNIVCVAVKA